MRPRPPRTPARGARRDVARGEEGNLPVAMLAVLVIAGLVMTLTATVVAGQRGTRADQGYEQTLAAAEIGLDRLTHQIRVNPYAVSLAPETATVAVGGGRTIAYAASAVRDATGWVVESTGVASDGARRTLRVRVALRGLFTLAAFGKDTLNLVGGNSVDSYDSASYDPANAGGSGSDICVGSVPAGPGDNDIRMCDRVGVAVVGTNGMLKIRSNTATTMRDAGATATVYNAREGLAGLEVPEPGATGYCSPPYCGANLVSWVAEPHEVVPDPVDLGAPPFDAVGSSGSFPPSAPLDWRCGRDENCIPPGVWEFDGVALDGRTRILGTPADPTIIGLDGALTLDGHVNFVLGDSDKPTVPRPPATLQVFMAGPGIDMRSHSSFAGVLYAPNAAFTGGARGNVYGSVVAGSIKTNGGWGFHYDTRLVDVTTLATPLRQDWSEL